MTEETVELEGTLDRQAGEEKECDKFVVFYSEFITTQRRERMMPSLWIS